MKCVYTASTSLDAYMVYNLLLNSGIKGRVDGEHLVGGIGGIQAINLVRVLVPDEEYEESLRIIHEWETQPS